MSTLPAITTFSNIVGHSENPTNASTVYNNDAALAGAFGSLEMSDSIANDNSPMLIGPIRVPIVATSVVALYRWTAPAAVELWELHVSPVSAVDGTTSDSTLSGSAYATISVYNAATLVASVEPQSLTTSYTASMSASGDRTVSDGAVITVQISGGVGAPKYHANISILAYTKHRE